MNHPWGISGPEFLWLYGGGLVVAIAWAVAVRMRARRPRLSEPPPTLDLEQLAFLAGGARRLIELSIARLLDAGAVRANRKGTLTSTSESRPDDPLDAEVLRKLGKRSLRADFLVREVKATKPVRQAADSLTARQLLLTPAAARRGMVRAVLALYVLLVVGLVRFVNGIVAELPVGYLAIELAVTVVLIIVLHNRRVRPRTVHGDRVLADARRTITSGVGLVALGGLAAYPDKEVGDALLRIVGTRSGSSTAWTYGAAGASGSGVAYASCSSGGASCGGSSGGGGGCGGGGGGGGGCGGGGGG